MAQAEESTPLPRPPDVALAPSGVAPSAVASGIVVRPLPARSKLRNYFLTGLIIVGPLALTAYITWSVVTLVDGWVKPFIPAAYLPETYLPFQIPGYGLIIALFGLTLLGFLTANLVGRSLIEFGENILARMPVVRGLYRGIKQVFETIFSQSGTSFRKVGLVQFPAPGMWSIVFISAPPPADLSRPLPQAGEYVSVFLPCTPNPTTGFFFYLPRREVIEVPLSVEEAAKLIMSAGLIQPEENQQRLQALAAVAPLPETAQPERAEAAEAAEPHAAKVA